MLNVAYTALVLCPTHWRFYLEKTIRQSFMWPDNAVVFCDCFGLVAGLIVRLAVRLVDPQPCANDDGTTDWSHSHVRSVSDLLLFERACPKFWTSPSNLLRPNPLVRSPTITLIMITYTIYKFDWNTLKLPFYIVKLPCLTLNNSI